jgi:16S rRNA (uracil1498-N3)-methyltransferase
LTVPKFYISSQQPHEGRLVLKGENHHHLSRVLRLQKEDEVEVLDGEGLVARGRVAEITFSRAVIDVSNYDNLEEEKPRMHLYQALPQGKKMDEVIQRCVELGIHAIHPFACARSRSLDFVDENKLRRWKKIAVESSRTAGRAHLPRVDEAKGWGVMIEGLARMDLVIMADEEGGEKPSRALQGTHPDDLGLIIGPEGGFTDREREDLAGAGAKAVTLGLLILRTEAAGAVLVAAARCHLGLL